MTLPWLINFICMVLDLSHILAFFGCSGLYLFKIFLLVLKSCVTSVSFLFAVISLRETKHKSVSCWSFFSSETAR